MPLTGTPCREVPAARFAEPAATLYMQFNHTLLAFFEGTDAEVRLRLAIPAALAPPGLWQAHPPTPCMAARALLSQPCPATQPCAHSCGACPAASGWPPLRESACPPPAMASMCPTASASCSSTLRRLRRQVAAVVTVVTAPASLVQQQHLPPQQQQRQRKRWKAAPSRCSTCCTAARWRR